MQRIDRRTLMTGVLACSVFGSLEAAAAQWPGISPSRGTDASRVGLGTWITFNVGRDPQLLAECTAVMSAFFAAGGEVIDSSPMYGSSQDTIGYGLAQLKPAAVLSVDKVWTPLGGEARRQIAESRAKWGIDRFSLLQVHNLVSWDEHLPVLFDMKKEGEVGLVGITTSHGRRHEAFERIIVEHPLDTVQFTYNPVDREAERRLLPLAMERGLTPIVNRPFRKGELTRRLAGEPLPGFAADLQATSWAQIILKFILAHPARPIPIPATTIPDHARENVLAASGPMPDTRMREAIAQAIAAV